jgi:hypothetical protein
MSDYARLKARHRAERDGWPESLSLRVHRALSWLARSEQCSDVDARFVFLWIAFNAAYAQELPDQIRESEKSRYAEFLKKLEELDSEGRLYRHAWEEFSGAFRVLLKNPYVFQLFWEFQRGKIKEEEWEAGFQSANVAANTALAKGETSVVLSVVLSRLYVLRNQMMHGGATWNGAVNRDQLRDACSIMVKLVPIVIELMMDNPHTLWGDPVFPVLRP